MSIVHAAPAPVSPEWHDQDATIPADLLVPPAEAGDCPCDRGEQARYVVRARHSTALGRVVWDVIDRSTGEALLWHEDRRRAEMAALDYEAEDHEPLVIGGRPWYEAPYPVALWDGPRVTPTAL